MTDSTHKITAIICVTVFNLIIGTPPNIAKLVCAAFFSITPDVDHPQSKAGKIYPPLSRYINRTVGRRRLTHGIFGWAIVAFLIYPIHLLRTDGLYSSAMIGLISHGLLDTTNLEGVYLLWPFFKNYCFVMPADEKYRVKVGSPRERVVRVILIIIMILLLSLNAVGEREVFRNLLGTPEAMARHYVHNLRLGYRTVVRIDGMWTQRQTRVSEEFDIIASTDGAIYVRRPSDPTKVYKIQAGGDSAISHSRCKIVRKLRAEQRVIQFRFNNQRWEESLADQYPSALITGSLRTYAAYAKPPTFGLDEFETIIASGGEWTLMNAPIEVVNQQLRGARITGIILIRYWRQKS